VKDEQFMFCSVQFVLSKCDQAIREYVEYDLEISSEINAYNKEIGASVTTHAAWSRNNADPGRKLHWNERLRPSADISGSTNCFAVK
jgi:hypothetical protein